MIDSIALTNEIASLAAVISAMRAPTVTPKVYKSFASNNPFDPYSHSGSSTYTILSAPLNNVWDGDLSTFSPFVVFFEFALKKENRTHQETQAFSR